MSKKFMVAVPATQPGATFGTHDRERFEREVVAPVKSFLEKTGGACRVLLFFYGKKFKSGHYGEEVRPDPDHSSVEDGPPAHEQTPGSALALTCFHTENVAGHVDIQVVTDERSLESQYGFIEYNMKAQGATETRILAPGRLEELAAELTVAA